ncbi:MAG: ion transporter [Adlercreutzia equolifaciens]
MFVSAQPGLDPVAANIIQGFYRFSTVCFFVEYIARIWIADLAYGNCTPARARLRYIFSPWGIIDFLSFGPNMAAWFLPVTPALQNVISVVRLVRLIKISRYMRGLRTIGRVISKHYHEIVASFLVIAMLVVVASVVMYEIEHPAQPDKFNNLLSGIYWAVTTVTGTGYGDLVPITPAGRIVGSVIIVSLGGARGHSRRHLLGRLRGRVPKCQPAQDRARRPPRGRPSRQPRRGGARRRRRNRA